MKSPTRTNPCTLCGACDTRRYMETCNHEIISCRKCGFLFAKPLSSALAPRYDEEYFGHFIARDAQNTLLPVYGEILRKAETMSPGRRLLDVGCGTGGFLAAAKNRGWAPRGVDGSYATIKYVVEKRCIEASVADLNSFILPKDAYEFVNSFHVIEHLNNPSHFLTQLHSSLVPGGLLCLGLPFCKMERIWLHNVLHRMRIANHRYDFMLPDHISYFSPKTLYSAVHQLGFDVIELWYSARVDCASLVATSKNGERLRRIIGKSLQPFDGILRLFGYFKHMNLLARKR
jgi:SAM-dependent methyltransferase